MRKGMKLIWLGLVLMVSCAGVRAQNSFPNGLTAGSGPNFWVNSAGTAGIMTSVGGPIFAVRQYGSWYGSYPSSAALLLQTDNPNGLSNYLLAGNLAGTITSSLRADGQAYFAGNVGIGTTAPGSKLEINGSLKLTSGSGASVTYADGTQQTTAWTGVLCGGDYAEAVNASGGKQAYETGDVLVLTSDANGDVQKSSEPYSTMVAGIFATKPGVIGRR